MLKNIYKISIFLVVFLFAQSALAATFTLTPGSISTKTGSDFNLSIYLNPNASIDYTAKVELKYPADMLQVNSFTPASGWMLLSQSGYDSIDNTNGVMIKTGGYPSGISTNIPFGTVSMRAKKAGNASISVGSNSMILDGNNSNAMSASLASATVSIAAPATTSTAQNTTAQSQTTVTQSIDDSSNNQIDESESGTTNQIDEQENNAAVTTINTQEMPAKASLVDFLTFRTGNAWANLLLAIIIILIVIYIGYLLMRKK